MLLGVLLCLLPGSFPGLLGGRVGTPPLWAQDRTAEQLLEAAEKALADSPERARQLAGRALDAGRRSSDVAASGRALEILTEASADLGRLDDAEGHARQRLALARETGDARGEATALSELADLASTRTRYAEAQALLEQARDLVEGLDDPRLTAQVHADLGIALRQQTRYPEALDHYRRSLAISEQLDDREAIGNRWNNIGVVLELMGDFEASLAAHERALQIDRETGDEGGVATSLYNIGEVHRELGDYRAALDNFRYALRVDERLGSPDDIGHSHNQIGLTLLDLGRLDEAREHTLEAERLFAGVEASRNVAWARSSRGRVELAAGDLDAAERLFEESLPDARESVSLTAGIWRDLAEVSLRRGELERARDRAEAALEAAAESGELDKEAEVRALLTRIHEAAGDLQAALSSARSELDLRRRIFDTERAGTIARTQNRLESVRREQEIELLERDRALREAEIDRQRMVRNGWIGGLLALFSLTFLAFSRVSQSRLNRELARQVGERTGDLRQKNEELERAYRVLEDVSLTDALTGLRNRRFLQQHVEADVAKALRDAGTASGREGGDGAAPSDLVFFLVDLDHFKSVNDRWGHAAGDALLTQVAERLGEVFRAADFLVRWGGEEFLGVARFVDRSRAPRLAERVRAAIAARPFETGDGSRLTQTCSIGFASFPFDRADPQRVGWETVVAVADVCLRLAKRGGRDAWVGVDRPRDPPDAPPVAAPATVVARHIASERWVVASSLPRERLRTAAAELADVATAQDTEPSTIDLG